MVEIRGMKELKDGFKQLEQRMSVNARSAVILGAEAYQRDVRAGAPRKTTSLIRSINVSNPSVSGTQVVAHVGSNLEYAKIHEFGGIIKAKNAPYLTFQTKDGSWHRVTQVQIPARPYFRPPLKNRAKYIKIITDAMMRGIPQ